MRAALAAILVLVLASPTLGLADESKPGPAEEAILQVERDFYATLAKLDGAAVGQLLTDDFVEITADGATLRKTEAVDGVAEMAKHGVTLTVTVNRARARLYGDAAIVTAGISVTFKAKDKTSKEDQLVTDVWVKQQGKWRLASSQSVTVTPWMARELSTSELTPIADKGCAGEASLRSQNSATKSFLRFNNTTGKDVTFFWMNFEGKRDQERVIKAAKSMDIFTYVTHPFVVVDAGGKCKGVYEPGKDAGLVTIK